MVLLLSNPSFAPQSLWVPVTTAQVALTILKALSLNLRLLEAVKLDGTEVLPETNAASKQRA